AGIQRGDVVVAVEGKPIESSPQLRNAIAAAGANRNVAIDVVRDGKRRRVRARLGELPGSREPVVASETPRGGGAFRELGVAVRRLDAAARRRYRIPDRLDHGVVVSQVEPGGFAAGLGLQPGDVILEINRQKVKTPKDFTQAYAKA